MKKKPTKRKSKAKKSTKKAKKEDIEEVEDESEQEEEVVEEKVEKKRKSKAKKSVKTKPAQQPVEDKPLHNLEIQPSLNIGTAGHVDEGKSTLIQLLTGKFPDEHSEELRRGITIRLGYADCDIYECPKCDEPEKWNNEPVCKNCGGEAKHNRRVSFVDAPGHEILMQVMLSGAAIMDGVMLVIAANNKVPQPQTKEHLAALTALGVDKVVVVQNKVELVSEKEAKQNYQDIKKFLKGTIAENAPIIPMSAMHGANMDLLLSAIQYFLPNPERDKEAPLRMHVARSFDINRPGTKPDKLKGGVLGGSLIQGVVHENEDVVILPGLKKRDQKGATTFIPIKTKVETIRVGEASKAKEATPGGLLAIQTQLDPSQTRSDNLAGSMVSSLGSEPPVVDQVTISVNLFEKVVGSDSDMSVNPISVNEPILLTIGTSTAVGRTNRILKKGNILFDIKPVIAIDPNSKVALSRQVSKRWRLIGWGEIQDFNAVPIEIKGK